jgi:hypothetical protein
MQKKHLLLKARRETHVVENPTPNAGGNPSETSRAIAPSDKCVSAVDKLD